VVDVDLQRNLLSAMQRRLSPQEQILLQGLFGLGRGELSVQQMAKLYGTSEGQVMIRVQNALSKLRTDEILQRLDESVSLTGEEFDLLGTLSNCPDFFPRRKNVRAVDRENEQRRYLHDSRYGEQLRLVGDYLKRTTSRTPKGRYLHST